MSITPRTGGHRPREPREPREVFICRPVLGNVRFSECYHLKLVSVGVFEKLDVNPSAPKKRAVAAGERKPAGNEVYVCSDRQLVSARPAQYQGVSAGSHLLRRGGTGFPGPVCNGIKEEDKGNILY